jgi:hypothetical protein
MSILMQLSPLINYDLYRFQVMPLCYIFFNLNSGITNPSYPRSIPRSTAVDDCDYNISKAPKISQKLPFYIPGIMFGEIPAKTYYALQVNRLSSLPTDLNQTDNVN